MNNTADIIDNEMKIGIGKRLDILITNKIPLISGNINEIERWVYIRFFKTIAYSESWSASVIGLFHIAIYFLDFRNVNQ